MSELLTYSPATAIELEDDAAALAALAATVPADVLRTTRAGEWSALDVIGHIADCAELFLWRIERCMAQTFPHFPDVDTDALVTERRAERDPADLARRITAAHDSIVRLLAPRGSTARHGIHGGQGRVNSGHLGAYHAAHAHDHLVALRAALGTKAR